MTKQISPVNPASLSESEFKQKYGNHLMKYEGRSLRIHTDHKGIPTFGPGYALAVKGTNDRLTLRPRAEIEAAIKRGTGNQAATLSDDEWTLLQDTTAAADAGNVDKAQELIPEHNGQEERQEKILAANNRFSFTIEPSRRIDVIQPEMEKAQTAVLKDIAVEARAQGWNDEQVAGYLERLSHSDEMIGLASLKFNMGANAKMPSTMKAMVAGDRALAAFEIEYRTNRNKVKGIANRRDAEAGFLKKNASPAEQKAIQKLNDDHADEVKAYHQKIGQKIGRTGEQPKAVPDAPDQAQAQTRVALEKALTQSDGPVADILEKQDHQWTDGEYRQIVTAHQSAKGGPEKTQMQNRTMGYSVVNFGDEPVAYDETGKMISPAPIRQIPTTPQPAVDKNGKPLAPQYAEAAKAAATGPAGEPAAETVKVLQTGLNRLSDKLQLAGAKTDDTKTDDATPSAPNKVKVDGDAGEKTRQAFKTAVREAGPKKVKEAVGLARFQRFAEQAAKGTSADGANSKGALNRATETAIGRLFPTQNVPSQYADAQSKTTTGSKAQQPPATPYGFGLQATVNDLGKTLPAGEFNTIKEDGIVGEKTEQAFAQVVPKVGADSFTRTLSTNLGFDDDEDATKSGGNPLGGWMTA